MAEITKCCSPQLSMVATRWKRYLRVIKADCKAPADSSMDDAANDSANVTFQKIELPFYELKRLMMIRTLSVVTVKTDILDDRIRIYVIKPKSNAPEQRYFLAV